MRSCMQWVTGVLVGVLFAASASAGPKFEVPVRINMGGPETIDSLGRVWLGDVDPANPSNVDPLDIRPDDRGGTNVAPGWGNVQADSLDALGLSGLDPNDLAIFNAIRWDLGDDGVAGDPADNIDFIIEIPLPEEEYVVNLYLVEGCCPQRHFKIEIQGEIVDDDVNYLDYDPVSPGVGRLGVLSFEGISVPADGILRIGLLPCFECPCPECVPPVVMDNNAIISAIEVLSAPECGTQGLDFNCTYTLATGAVSGTWASLPGAENYRILKDGQAFGALLPPTTTSFTDPDPSSGGPSPTYVLQALDGGVAFQECRCVVNAYDCPVLTCTANPAGEVALSWTEPIGAEVLGYQIKINGTIVAETYVGTTFEDNPSEREVEYVVTPVTSPDGLCGPMKCSVFIPTNPFEIPLRINMGGIETVDSQGRVWLGDGPGTGDPLSIRADDLSGTNTIENWCVPEAESMTAIGFDPASAADRYILSTIRWDTGDDGVLGDPLDNIDFRLEIPVPDGTYTVKLYFIEQCCPGRHFKVEINGEVRDEDVSYVDYAPEPALIKAGRLAFTQVEVTDGFLRIGLLPCPECIGASDINAIVCAVEVTEGNPCDDPGFRQCPGSLSCGLNPASKQVTGSWEPALCFTPTGYEVRKNGELVTTLPGSALSFTDTLGGRVGHYEVRALVPAGTPECATLTCTVVDPSVSFTVPLRINMGGSFLEDSRGQLWWGDGPGGDPLDIRLDELGGAMTNLNWCPLPAVNEGDALEALGFDPLNPNDRALFNDIRWDVADDVAPGGVAGDPSDDIDFRLEIPIPNGNYLVNLYFIECCCFQRHFKIELEGDIVMEDFYWEEYLAAQRLGRSGRASFDAVSVTDGSLSIGLLPCYECPFDPFPVLDPNPMVSAIEVLPAGSAVTACPQGLNCAAGGEGEVALSWTGPLNSSVTGYDLYRNGEKIQTLPASATTFEDEPACQRAIVYELVPLGAAFCPGIKLRCVYMMDLTCPFVAPVRINMGAAQAVDSLGNVWLGDGPGTGDPLEIRPDDLGGAESAENWSVPVCRPETLEALGLDPGHPGDMYVFNSIRWDQGINPPDFLLEIPLDDGEYTVNLFLNEGCCPNRHQKIALQDEIVADDVHGEVGILRKLSFEAVQVEGGILRIGLIPCQDCPGGGNIDAIVDAIEILGTGVAEKTFHRGDANADGTINITDGIFVLNYLFLGGPKPPCLEAANPNDDPSINITDGIYILNYLFLGGPAPTSPGPPPQPCGPDPGPPEKDLGCITYTKC